jgi:hypothetical protein
VRFMIMVKGNRDTEAGLMPGEALLIAMADYHEQLARAGVLLDATGLQATSKGFKVRYAGGTRTIVDGPFTEAKEIVAGYTLIQVKSREEAVEWARRFPSPFGEGQDGEIEVRQLFELEDFAPGEAVDRLRDTDGGLKA